MFEIFGHSASRLGAKLHSSQFSIIKAHYHERASWPQVISVSTCCISWCHCYQVCAKICLNMRQKCLMCLFIISVKEISGSLFWRVCLNRRCQCLMHQDKTLGTRPCNQDRGSHHTAEYPDNICHSSPLLSGSVHTNALHCVNLVGNNISPKSFT